MKLDEPELHRLLERLAASYASAAAVNNLQSAALPNRRAIVAAMQHIRALLFAGYYSTPGLRLDNLREHLRPHLRSARKLLLQQVERALAYRHWTCALSAGADSASADAELRQSNPYAQKEASELVDGLFSGLPELRYRLEDDVQAAFEGDPAAASVEEVVFSYPSIQALAAHRVAHELHRLGIPLIPRILTEDAHSQTGIDIHPGAQIGRRFFIDHGSGVVIGESSVIGDHVKIYQGVTLGALSIPRQGHDRGKRHPTLGDHVTVYAGATILGGDTVIGDHSVIGANVWITHSVAPQSKVIGHARDIHAAEH